MAEMIDNKRAKDKWSYCRDLTPSKTFWRSRLSFGQ
jgi:hypothetical protein